MTAESFYGWMCRHARAMGWDLDEEAQKTFHVWAAIASTNGLDDEQTAQLARGLGVIPDEVTAAYQPEMREAAMGELLEQPDLAALDVDLDRIAGDEPPRWGVAVRPGPRVRKGYRAAPHGARLPRSRGSTMADSVRTYLVINSGALFGPGRRIEFRSSCPAGSVVPLEVDGRPVRALLTDTPLGGGVLAAELQDCYL
ncbi:hypothetical protein [Streptomyces sp. NBC_00268]|uniref:hypothetical protein n=1 Tax=Streptomyces sp. NBC_00268 TaxID=2975695 RepID=UPI0022536F5E|nr:hypothetical protein [Streptomyces sp. NBC_00268]MCX5182596.1 hypothetical protein [Streptomyces sp. NBC_00268]